MQESEYPLVSICMPVYNGARFLPYTIDNILAQSYRNIELIIVDDGSIDDSYNIAKQYVNKSKRRGIPCRKTECFRWSYFSILVK